MAASNDVIILESQTKGKFWEGYVNAALKPGTVCQIDISEGIGPDGRYDWEAFNLAADGERTLIAVLLPDHTQGKLATAAYVSGDRCFLYTPANGEELNMLVANIAGTGDSFAIGDKLIVDDGTGKLIATTGTPESEPFIVGETVAALTADTLVHCIYTGY